MTRRIVFLDDYQAAAQRFAPLDRLDGWEVEVLRDHLAGDALVAALAGAEVAVAMRERTRFDRELLSRLPDLRLLCTTGPANAAIDLAAAGSAGVTVSATGGSASPNTAEMTWALILAAARNLTAEAASVASGGWQTSVGMDLAGSTIGLVGLGRIGSRMARIAAAFDMEVLAWSQHLDAARAAEVGAAAVGKEELLARSDVVSIHLVLSERSRGCIGEAELRAMKPSALLVNTSRGPIVDEAALVRALEEGWIGGAGIDVFGEEPLPDDHPLRRAPHCIATPHLGYVTPASLAPWYRDVVDDILAWAAGAPIRVLTA